MATNPAPSAHVVGNAFVHQYYLILHQSPELVYRFYQEKSTLGRPDADSGMSSVTTMDAINEKILSLDYSRHRAEIRSVDAQESLDGGVLVLVTGYLTKPDGPKRNFSQSFFLAPQEKGFYVLNDIFRYMDEPVAHHEEPNAPNGASVPQLPENDTSSIQEQEVLEHNGPVEEEGGESAVAEVYNPSDNDDGSVVDEEVPVSEVVDEVSNNNSSQVVAEISNVVQEDAPKKSYASIVKVMKENSAPLAIPPVTAKSPSTAKVSTVISQRQPNPSSVPASSPEVSASSPHANGSSSQDEAADGYSIYVRSLPYNATVAQLEEEFKKFGPIKKDGIQVRSNKQQGYCFGFVEFEVASAVQSAIEASPIMIGGRAAYAEVKRTTGSRGSRGRFIPGRGDGFRSDGTRGRGGYGGGRGYGRGDYVSADFGRGRRGGSSNRVDMGYQRVDSGGRSGRSAGEIPFKNASNGVPALA